MMTDTDATPPPPKKPAELPLAKPVSGRGLRIALAVSVALNLAVAGVAAGVVLRNHSGDGRNDGVRELGFGPFTEALSPQDRRALRQSYLASAPDIRGMKRQRRDDAMAVLQALRATPFNPESLTALMAAQQQRMAQQLTLGQQVLGDFLIAMAPADRAAFAKRLEDRLRPKGGDGEQYKKGDAAP